MTRIPSIRQLIIYTLLAVMPVGAHATDYLFTFLGGNARGDLWVVDRATGQVLLSETADAKTVAENTGHYGNIALHAFEDTDQHAGWLADHLIRKTLPQLRRMEFDGQIKVTSLSFMYALAGLNVVDGQVPGYDPAFGRRALHQLELIVDGAFQSEARTLSAMYGVSDTKLFLQAMDVLNNASEGSTADLIVYADTYSIGFLKTEDGLRVRESFADDPEKTPAGGFFQLGKTGSQTLYGEQGAVHLTEAVRKFWEKQGCHYTNAELQQRYEKTNRNELGGVLAEMGINPELWQLNDADVSVLQRLVHDTARDISKMLSELVPPLAPEQKQPVAIIGFYADILNASPTFYQALRSGLTERYEPRLIHGGELSWALAGAAIRVFNEVSAARYP